MPTKPWDKQRFRRFLFALFTETLFLNLDILHFQPLSLWSRLLPPLLLVLGLLGSAYEVRPLRFAGWVGIMIFLLISLLASFPSEDYLFGGPDSGHLGMPRTVGNANTLVRVIIGMVITLLLFQLYRRLQTSPDRE